MITTNFRKWSMVLPSCADNRSNLKDSIKSELYVSIIRHSGQSWRPLIVATRLIKISIHVSLLTLHTCYVIFQSYNLSITHKLISVHLYNADLIQYLCLFSAVYIQEVSKKVRQYVSLSQQSVSNVSKVGGINKRDLIYSRHKFPSKYWK